MADDQNEQPVLYMPDTPNVGAADPDGNPDDPKRAAKDQARADDLAAKVAVGVAPVASPKTPSPLRSQL